jgi:uncharacterized protein DUF6527
MAATSRRGVKKVRTKWRVLFEVEAADDVPALLPHQGVALVGTDAKPKWLVFDCPCLTGHRVMLNLDRSRWPWWHLSTREPLTVRPSIDDANSSRRCHFFLRRGRVLWVRGTEGSWHR